MLIFLPGLPRWVLFAGPACLDDPHSNFGTLHLILANSEHKISSCYRPVDKKALNPSRSGLVREPFL